MKVLIKVQVLTLLVMFISAIHLSNQQAPTLQQSHLSPTQASYKIKSKDGGYLDYCNNCINSPLTQVIVGQSTQNQNQTVWTITNIGNYVKIQANNNEYLSLPGCKHQRKCQGKVYTQQSEDTNEDNLLWHAQFYEGLGWAFKSKSGKYLERQNGTNAVLAAKSVINVNSTGFFWILENGMKAGNITLIGFDKGYMMLCNLCGNSDYYNNSVSIERTDPEGNRFWQLQIISQSKVAFKGTNGLYLAICQNCWQHGSLYENDAIFVYVTDASAEPKAQWSPVLLDKGRWAFIGSNGLGLSRCIFCSLGVTKNIFAYAFIDLRNPNAHWVIQYN